MAGGADLLLVGGKVFTATRDHPWAKAFAVRDGRILAVGTESQVSRMAERSTRRIDLRGRVVVPGFIDSHTHMADSAGEFGWTRLDRARSLVEALDRLRKAAGRIPRGEWVIGIDWDEAKWPERRYPTREDLDRVSKEHPVVARRIDCHVGSVNSMALERASDLVSLRGFEVDGSGRPTGILKEEAFGELYDRFASSPAVIERNLSRMARMAHRLGITSIHDVVTASGWEAYQRARRAGRLSLRVTTMTPSSVAASLTHAGIRTGLGDEWLRVGPVKVFSDGSLGAYTAALDAPYEGRPKERGMLVHPPTELRSILAAAHHAGLQTATHAIGDAAVRLVAETLAEIQQEDPRDPLRHRPGDVYESRLGSPRIQTNNPYRQIAQLGIPLCFGSDGMPYGPLYGIHWAVNGYFEDQRLSPVEAFRAYTAGGAHAAFEERTKGTLEPGLWADFVILDGDPFVDPSRIDRCRVRETWIGGDRVYPVTKS